MLNCLHLTQCHAEKEDHPLQEATELVLACKQCKKVFRKDLTREIDESDEYCPHCDNHYVLDADVPEEAGEVRMEAQEGKEADFIRDTRDHNKERRRARLMQDQGFLQQHIKNLAARSEFQ